MKAFRPIVAGCGAVLAVGGATLGAQSVEETLGATSAGYAQRVVTAAEELAAVRDTIAADKAPLVTATRAAEDRVLELLTEIERLEVTEATAGSAGDELQQEAKSLERNLAYVATVAGDGLKALSATLRPGEGALYAKEIAHLQQQLEGARSAMRSAAALQAVDLGLERLRRTIGGYTAPGTSLFGGSNEVVTGTFAFVGPEAFFRHDADGTVGTVRERDGGMHPTTHVLDGWERTAAAALFEGREGVMPADATGGKALRMWETRGTLLDHLRKGGVVGYIIIGLGAIAALITVLKVVELRQLAVDEPAALQGVIDALSTGAMDAARTEAASLQATTRELLATGFRHAAKTKELLEEHLYAFILRQRLQHERRLPLLAVIVTAGPLLGLLGTVTGMVKTFTLVTVFGTGNAERLSSGISEALVTTELGLIVAIPTLVVHGYLAHRAKKKLALLERHAFEFVTAVEEAKAPRAAGPEEAIGV